MIKNFFILLAVLIAGLLFSVVMIVFVIPVVQESTAILPPVSMVQADSIPIGTEKEKLEQEILELQARLAKYTPTDAYVVVNTSSNHFYLYDKNELFREGVCSTGKNERLIDSTKREYAFFTPIGVRTVKSKQKNPVWAKPDWAFVEEGLPIPPKGDASRFEAGTLGAYKLVLGDGYMIHGTLYKRFMGQNVTHGCIRLLDDDLEAVYKTLGIGSKVYIF
jgi:lipoprotein-anchoring transpeptidase ErfK/SrfK